jgi:hypothetical protein
MGHCSGSAPFLGSVGVVTLGQRVADREAYAPVDKQAAKRSSNKAHEERGVLTEARNHLSPRKKSNLDASGMRLVRKGAVVMFRGGFTARVARVRLGHFYTELGIGSRFEWPCRYVQVIG